MTLSYRKIWEAHYGPIPKDQIYDIHHIDGDRSNNDISNLRLVTPREHYDIHYAQGDWGACHSIAQQRLNITATEISDLASKQAKERVSNGTHHWLSEKHSQTVSKSIKRRVEDGTYHMLGGAIQKEFQLKRSQEKKHQWNGSQHNIDKLKNGTHASQKEWVCPNCLKAGKGSTNAKRWHFDNCKEKNNVVC